MVQQVAVYDWDTTAEFEVDEDLDPTDVNFDRGPWLDELPDEADDTLIEDLSDYRPEVHEKRVYRRTLRSQGSESKTKLSDVLRDQSYDGLYGISPSSTERPPRVTQTEKVGSQLSSAKPRQAKSKSRRKTAEITRIEPPVRSQERVVEYTIEERLQHLENNIAVNVSSIRSFGLVALGIFIGAVLVEIF